MDCHDRTTPIVAHLGAIASYRYHTPVPRVWLWSEAYADFHRSVPNNLFSKGDTLSADALMRIEDESYGLCESCGGPIALNRLKARPVTTLCIDCKSDQESQERRSRGS